MNNPMQTNAPPERLEMPEYKAILLYVKAAKQNKKARIKAIRAINNLLEK